MYLLTTPSLLTLYQMRKFYLLLFLFSNFSFSHTGHHAGGNGKIWHFQDAESTLSGDFISSENGMVTLRLSGDLSIQEFPLEAFAMEDQLVIMERIALAEKFNNSSKRVIHLKSSQNRKISRFRAWTILILFSILIISFLAFSLFSKHKKPSLLTSVCSFIFLVIVACAKEDDSAPPASNTSNTETTPPDNNDSNSDNSDSNSDDSNSNTDDSNSNTDDNDSGTSSETTSETNDTSSILATIVSHFENFSGVTISSDDEYFYINSYSWPEHGMGKGITAWQEQVPIPQNYTGDNSWTIPLQPEMAETALNTTDHFLKGALAVAVNGVPIFNVLNNRGENAFLIGELDDWGGHFGRGDDYHYHLVPTHLEEMVGSESPLAYALDGYPVYGFTEESLDEAFGRTDSNGNYRYHASADAPYFMPYVKGVVTIDPASTAPEDQIFPQPIQNPVRPSDDFKPVNGASVNGITQTGTNAFSFEYEVAEVKYYINYNWDENCNFSFTHVDENGGSTNLPTNGSIAAGSSENVESFSNVKFCTDVSLGNTSSSDDSVTDTGTDDSSDSTTGFSATSTQTSFSLSSVAIDASGSLLDAYKCEQKVNGIEKSIPIQWSNVPEGTGSLAISIHGFPKPEEINSYLTLWNIDPSVTEIPYGEANNGAWYMGPNKDGANITYSSPCNPSGATSTYYMTIFALSETPSSLPSADDLSVNYSTLLASFSEVTIIDSVVLEYVATPSE